MTDEYEYLTEIGAGGLILLAFVWAFKTRDSSMALIIFILLLEGQASWSHAQHDCLYNATWGTFELRKFTCAAIACTPGVVALWVLFRMLLSPDTQNIKEAGKPG